MTENKKKKASRNNQKLKAPFPYFGGKSKVSDIVWQALGNPAHYIEPFFGSGAVLLNRPDHDITMTETICDADGYVANVWRSIQFAPDEVSKWCDWPVNHADLIARKARLIRQKNYLLEGLCKDDKWHDVELAGYWIWAASCWIGSGLTCPKQRPNISNKGMGVHAVGKRPDIGNKGKGVHAVGRMNHIYEWMNELSHRLRRVRVVCGDWNRVCGGNWQDNIGVCGIFFDPPYSADRRDVYAIDSYSVAHDVREWCLARGDNPRYRIVLAGYFEEHESLLKHGWTVKKWSATGGYANIAKSDSRGKVNRHKEALFFSPHCLNKEIVGCSVSDNLELVLESDIAI